MDKRILVAYASRTGTTSEIAEVIGDRLSGKGFIAVVRHLSEVKDLSTYESVIIGSAIQGRQWLPEALDFVRENLADLRKIKTAIFTVCITLSMENGKKYLPEIMKWVQPVKEMIHPVLEAYFAGKLDIRKISSLSDRLKFRLSVLAGIWKEGDHRDWNTIYSWTDDLAGFL